jgi:hypothetical protein
MDGGMRIRDNPKALGTEICFSISMTGWPEFIRFTWEKENKKTLTLQIFAGSCSGSR